MNCFMRGAGAEEKGGKGGRGRGREKHKKKYETFSALKEVQGRQSPCKLEKVNCEI